LDLGQVVILQRSFLLLAYHFFIGLLHLLEVLQTLLTGLHLLLKELISEALTVLAVERQLRLDFFGLSSPQNILQVHIYLHWSHGGFFQEVRLPILLLRVQVTDDELLILTRLHSVVDRPNVVGGSNI